jgi:large subunit ribosomal protein L30e
MSLIEEIQSALKEDKVVIGYKNSLEFIKTGTPKLIVMASNTPKKDRADVEHDAKISGAKIEIFEGSSKELGVICGRPFPIMLLIIKK